jgi:hypothetical protein
VKIRCSFGLLWLPAVGQFGNTMQNTYRQGLPAFRTNIFVSDAFFRFETDITFAMPVHVVFAFFRKKFIRTEETFPCFQGIE